MLRGALPSQMGQPATVPWTLPAHSQEVGDRSHGRSPGGLDPSTANMAMESMDPGFIGDFARFRP